MLLYAAAEHKWSLPGYFEVTNSAPSKVKQATAGWLVVMSGDMSKQIPSLC